MKVALVLAYKVMPMKKKKLSTRNKKKDKKYVLRNTCTLYSLQTSPLKNTMSKCEVTETKLGVTDGVKSNA